MYYPLREMARQNYQPGNPATLQLKSTKQRSKTETAKLVWSRTLYAH